MSQNCLQNVNGFSPCQIAFGRNPNLPCVLRDKLPALEGETVSQIFGSHINAMHHARQAYVKAECSEKIRRALRKQTCDFEESCKAGDKVYYKRPDSRARKGHGSVIGSDGPIVFVRHGGALIRVHKCRVRKVGISQSVNSDMSFDSNGPNNSEVNDHDKNGNKVGGNAEGEIELPSGIADNARVENTSNSGSIQVQNECVEADDHGESDQLHNAIDSSDSEVSDNTASTSDMGTNERVSDNAAAQVDAQSQRKSCRTKTKPEWMKDYVNENGDEVMVTEDVDLASAKQAELDSWAANNVYGEVEFRS